MSEKLIHQYLDGLMNKVERADFEERVKKDPTLSSELSLIKDMNDYAHQQTQIDSSSLMIKEVGDEFKPTLKSNNNASRNKTVWKYLLPLAAAAVLLLGLFIRPTFTSNSLDQINYEASPLSFQVRGTESNELLLLSADAFNRSDYPLAISQLSELITLGQEVDKARLYKGIALLRNGNHAAARAELKILEQIELFKNASYYYQGLSYMDTGNSSQAEHLLKLIDTNSSYFDRAQKRLDQLPKTK